MTISKLYSEYKIDHLLANNSFKGILIAVEGGDGAGKTTFTKYLFKQLGKYKFKSSKIKLPTRLLKNSYIFNLDKLIKENNIVATQLLRMAERILLTNNFIIPSLNKGKIIIIERYLISSLGTFYNNKIQSVWFKNLLPNILKPDIWIWLHAEPHIIRKRLSIRTSKKDKRELFLKNHTYNAGLLIARKNNLIVINTSHLSLRQCFNQVLQTIHKLNKSKNYEI